MSDDRKSGELADVLQGIVAIARSIERTSASLVASGRHDVDGMPEIGPPGGPRAMPTGAPRLDPASDDGDGDTVFAAADAAPTVDPKVKRLLDRILNVYETGSVRGDYGKISTYNDGPNQIRQVTYGRSQTTEFGNLPRLIEMYADARGIYSAELSAYVGRVGQMPSLVDDQTFLSLLRRAGSEDVVMRRTQDVFFDIAYFQPAMRWADRNGFRLPLSLLVIYDSFIHSGSIRPDLRQRFPEVPPAAGGDEEEWTAAYVEVRHDWLLGIPRLRATAYRTRDLLREIERGNWMLDRLPYVANGTAVNDMPDASGIHAGVAASMSAESSGEGFNGAWGGVVETAVVWSELEPPPWIGDRSDTRLVPRTAAGATETRAALAARILDHPNVTLAVSHVSGRRDDATARRNVEDTAAGRNAKRSNYGTAPGDEVALSVDLLRGILALADRFQFSISEIAGGSHNETSRHYAGSTMDINEIDGRRASAANPSVRPFMRMCRDLGTTETLGPGDPGHSTHVHAGWPRPS